MSATGRNLYIDAPLSNIVVGRNPTGFIADRIFPVVPVGKQGGLYYTTGRKDRFRFEANISARAPLAEPRKVTFNISSDSYYARNYALAAEWPVEDDVNADTQINLAEMNATNVSNQLKYDFETRVAALANTAANISTTAQVNTAWSFTDAKIFTHLNDNIERFRVITGVLPNRLIIPQQVATYVRANDQIRDMLFGDRGGLATPEQLAGLLGIQEVLIPSIMVNTQGETETENGSGSLANVWGNYVHLMHVNPLQGQFVDTWGQAFRWTNPKLGQPWAVRRAPTDEKRGAEYLDVHYYQDEKIVSSDLNLRIESVV